MTPEQIYRALCIVDPALEPWQKCEHKWTEVPEERVLTNACPENPSGKFTWMRDTCSKCRCTRDDILRPVLPVFGDGKPRYGSVDELLSLCERLKVQPYLDTSDWLPGYNWVVGRVVGDGYVRGQAHMGDKVLGLQEAILRAIGGWTE